MTSTGTTTYIPLTSLDQLRQVGVKLRRRTIGSGREWDEGTLASTTPDREGDYHVDGRKFSYVFRSDFDTSDPDCEYQIEASTEQWKPLTYARQAKPGDRVRQIIEDVVVEHSIAGGLRMESGEYFTSYSIGGAREGHTYEVLTSPIVLPQPIENDEHRILTDGQGGTWVYALSDAYYFKVDSQYRTMSAPEFATTYPTWRPAQIND